ncbi:scarecrow-like protein 8 [Rutidosis leptorrhynchoides]|uniref:scarecrow-like protein 8 n=1 Tax=Rutidosis leptorrhynchoides TaxID=125765 RepID=UPI003A99322E
MSSGFSGGYPDFFNINNGSVNNVAGRSIPMMSMNNSIYRNNYRSPLASILSDTRSDLIGKRSLAEFQQQQHLRQQASVYLRNVKPRGYNHQPDLLPSPEVSSFSNISSSLSSVSRYGNGNYNGGVSTYQTNGVKQEPLTNQETDRKMLNRLHELEKELLLDDDEVAENDAVSVVTQTEWSETIQKLLNPVHLQKPENDNNIFTPSPTTSSSSSCASSSTIVSAKQLISEAAEAIADGKLDAVLELLTRLNQVSNARGTPEQRVACYLASALRMRVRVSSTATADAEKSSSATDLYKKEHIMSTQLMYDKSPCFKLAFMGANNVIMQTVSDSDRPDRNGKIHVVDFDIGHGLQYVYLIHEIAAVARKGDYGVPIISLKLTTFKDFGNGGAERLKLVGDGLKMLAKKLGVLFDFNILEFKLIVISRDGLAVENGDLLAVNFAFKLNKLPDESVTTDNLRDEVLRRVKGLSPAVVTVAEQELNGNTASLTARVNDVFSYYTTFLDSCDATIPRDNSDRVKIEEGLSRRIVNSVACEGRDRVERCEVFGKWRARLKMAGFVSKPVSQLTVDSLSSKLNSGARGNPGFTVKEDSGGISFGWLGRTITVVSAWC